jgi:hypothetical protein
MEMLYHIHRQPLRFERRRTFMIGAQGWAVCHNDQIHLDTVAPTRRAAIINWLTTSKDIMALAQCPDAVLEKLWDTLREGADLMEIVVTPMHAARVAGDGSSAGDNQ